MNCKLFVLFIAFTLFCKQGHTQRNYRVQARNKQEYNLPPYTNLKFKSNGKAIRKRFSKFYIDLRKLNSDYSLCLQSFNNAVRWNGQTDYFEPNSEKEISKLIIEANKDRNGCKCPIKNGVFFKAAILEDDGSRLFLQIDFDKLTKDNIKDNFNSLLAELVRTLAGVEGNNVCGCPNSIKWPIGFSQQLNKQLKEWIPMPADLPQPGTCYTEVDDQSYFILLDDDIALKVDKTEKITTLVGSDTKFQYEWDGFNIFSFERSSTGAVVQNSFASFNNGLPNNARGNNTYKIASFADIQSSEALMGLRYIALYHPPLKRNNDQSSTGGYSANDDNKTLVGNPFLLHFKSSEIAGLDFKQAFGNNDGYTKSFLSERGSIAPLIKVYINGNETFQSIKTHPTDIKSLPGRYNLFRKFGTGYRKVKGNKGSVFFLPNDQVNYTL